jgi:hypothetical protein
MASPNQTTPRQIDWKQVGDYLLGRSTLIGLASLMLGGRGRGVRPAMPSHQQIKVTTMNRTRTRAPNQLGFLLDELRSAGVTTYGDLAASLNRQGIRPGRGRWKAHEEFARFTKG